MRYWLGIALLLVTAGCAQRSVILHKQSLNTQQQAQVISLLNAHNFTPEVSAEPTPPNIKQPVLLVSDTDSPSHYHTIVQAFQQAGWPSLTVQSAPPSAGLTQAHLYLPDSDMSDLRQITQQKLITTYKAYRCDEKAKLTLQANQRFTLKRKSLDGERREPKITGQWTITQWPYIRLTAKSPYMEQFLEVSEHIEQEEHRQFRVISLRPLEVSRLYTPCIVSDAMRID